MARGSSPFTGVKKGRTGRRKKSSSKRGSMARKRKRGRPRKTATAAPRKRRRKARTYRARARSVVRRTRRRVGAAIAGTRRKRRRVGGRRRRGASSSRGMSTRNIIGTLKQAVIDGGFVVLGDVSANIAKILTGQTGILGNVAQLGGGLAAGFVVSKYVSRDAGRMVLAGAAAGIVKQFVNDQVLPLIPAGTAKTNLTAALQGYPHSDFAAQMQGYVGAGNGNDQNNMGLPSGSVYQSAY